MVFGTLAACSAVFCVSYLPETRGKTLLEVQALLAAPVRAGTERHVHPSGGRTAVDGLPTAMTSSSLLRAGTPWSTPVSASWASTVGDDLYFRNCRPDLREWLRLRL